VNNERFEAENTYKLRMIFDGISSFFTTFLPTFSFTICFLIFPETINLSSIIALIYMQIFFLPFGILLIYKGFLNWYPVYRIKCQISLKAINFYIQNRIYLHFNWNDIKKIEFLRELYADGMGSIDTYKIKIYFLNQIHCIRLYALRFKKENVKLILSKLKEFSSNLNIEMLENNELNQESDIYKQQYKDEQDVLRFYKNQSLLV